MNNKLISLTKIEFQLLYIFVKNANKILTRNYLLKMVWEFEPERSQTLKVHLYRLKKKLFKILPKEDLDIVSIKGSGYMLIVKKIIN